MRNDVRVTLVACTLTGIALSLPSCAHLLPAEPAASAAALGAPAQPAAAAPLLAEPEEPLRRPPRAELSLPTLEAGRAAAELAADPPAASRGPATAALAPAPAVLRGVVWTAEPSTAAATGAASRDGPPPVPACEAPPRLFGEPVAAAALPSVTDGPAMPAPRATPPAAAKSPQPAPKAATSPDAPQARPKPQAQAQSPSQARPQAQASPKAPGASASTPAPSSPAQSSAREAPRTAPAAPPADSPRVETVYGPLGGEVQVALAGEGWVLLGVQGATSASGPSGLRFVRRDLLRERTIFVFRGERLGEYEASFQRQQLSTGSLDSSRALVKVVHAEELLAGAFSSSSAGGSAPSDSRPAASPAGSSPQPGSASSGAQVQAVVSRAAADRLYALGLDKAALAEYRKLASGTGADDPWLTDRIAELCEKQGGFAEALSLWSSIQAVPDYRERATAGVVRAAAALGRGDRVASNLDALYAIRSFGIGKELVRIARYAEKAGDNSLGLTVLEEYLARYPQGEEIDEVYFRLGGVLEKPWEGRDLKRSRSSYEAVLRDYPTSQFALSAGERLDYLLRHFFYVR